MARKRKASQARGSTPKKNKETDHTSDASSETDDVAENSSKPGASSKRKSTSAFAPTAEHGASASSTPKGEPNLKIISWNVSGLRSWIGKGGFAFLKKENPDMIFLQETKCPDNSIPAEAAKLAGYQSHFLGGDKEGYAGIGFYTKIKPLQVKFGLGIPEHDNHGRLITAEYDNFYLIGAYVPNSGRGLPRLGYRQKWNKDFLAYIKSLDAKKPVIYCGDLNVAHEEIDLKNPASNHKTAGFTDEERRDFTTLLNAGFVDAFRHLYPDKTNAYTFWSYMRNARASNTGWRLDYFVLSQRLIGKLCDVELHSKVMGSDHCPISLTMAM